MRRRTYLLFGLIASPFALLGLRFFTAMTKRPRVRVLVTNEKEQVLLMRGVVSRGHWTLPGGGVKRGETIVAAGRRELFEETGIDLPESAFEFVKILAKPDVRIPFVAPLIKAKAKQAALPSKLYNPREVIEVAWFDKKQLPSNISIITQTVLNDSSKQ